MNEQHHKLDELYRQFYQQICAKSARVGHAASKEEADVDYNELSTLAEGTASQMCQMRARLRRLVDPAYAALWTYVMAEVAPPQRTIRLSTSAAWLPRTLAVAASFVVVGGISLLVATWTGLRERGTRGYESHALVFRGAPLRMEDQDRAVYTGTPGVATRHRVYDRAVALLVDTTPRSCRRTPTAAAGAATIDRLAAALADCQFAEILCLQGNEATYAAILTAVKRMLWEAGSNGAVFIYFNGTCLVDGVGTAGCALVPHSGVATAKVTRARTISVATLNDLARLFHVKSVCLALEHMPAQATSAEQMASLCVVTTPTTESAGLAGRLIAGINRLHPGHHAAAGELTGSTGSATNDPQRFIFAKDNE